MNITRAGEKFDVNAFPDDDWRFWDRWSDGRWEPEAMTLLDQCLTPNSTFVDIGAWIGPLTLWASRRCARVVAVEPDPVAREYLIENVARNGIEDMVTIVDAAISDINGAAAFGARGHGDDPGEFGNSMSQLGRVGAIVETLTPEELWTRYRIEDVGLVKVDIEGGEARLVDHAEFLRQWPLLLALHGPWMEVSDQRRVSAAFDCDATNFDQVFLPTGA